MQKRNGNGASPRGVMFSPRLEIVGPLTFFSSPEKKQEKTKVDSTTGSVDGSPASRAAPLPPGDDGTAMDVDKSGDGEGGKDAKDGKDTHAPVKKYKMTEAMKGLIWNLVCLSNECCRIENEKKYVHSKTWSPYYH